MAALVLFVTQLHNTYAQIPGIPGSENGNENLSRNTESGITENNRTSDNFLIYKNNQYGYTIGYPADWETREITISQNTENAPGILLPSVNIVSPGEVATLSVAVKNATLFLDTNDMKVKSKAPHDYVIDEIKDIANIAGDKYIRDKPVMLINNTIPAWELEHTYPSMLGRGTGTVYNAEYFVVKDNRVYNFLFYSDSLQVPTYLPIVEKMIDSFQITK